MSHEQSGSPEKKRVGSELSLPDFMSQNFERDPDWFVEPENTPEYGPPGMPTPLRPMDPRIIDRQHAVSSSLRGLLDVRKLPIRLGLDAPLDQHMFDMLYMNFDSYNTILGINNNDSYVRWKEQIKNDTTDPELQTLEERAILGVASQHELIDLVRRAEGLRSVELFKLYHPFMYRMRHLQHRRAETKHAIEESGGDVVEDPQFYDLKLSPYVVPVHRELTIAEKREISLLATSVEKKWKALNQYMEKTFNGDTSDEIVEAISNQIDKDEARLQCISDSLQVHAVEGLMASIKTRVGTIPQSGNHQINVTERQLFAVNVVGLKQVPAIQEALQHIHSRQTTPDEEALRVQQWVYDEFIGNTESIIPVSTTTYCYETDKISPDHRPIATTLARVATKSSLR